MEPAPATSIALDPSAFNDRPLEALKDMDNKLMTHPFYSGKAKRKTDTLKLDLAAPMLGQFNLFKMREFQLDDDHRVIDIAPGRLKNCGEDDFYIQDEKILEICRRGLCILLDQKTLKQRILRLGLRKFFYMNVDDLVTYDNTPGASKAPKKPAQQSKVDQNAEKIAEFSTKRLQQLSAQGVTYRMTGTSKLNGENLQISYDGYLASWVVCSKNVTLITKDFNDLARYENNQIFTVSLRIVSLWRQALQKLDPAKVTELQTFLANERCSLIGEICGNVKMQHIVHYENEEIYFYAISRCEFGRGCLNPTDSCRLFQNFGLRHEAPIFEDLIHNRNDLETALPAAIDKINKTSYDKIGEGVVLYFSKIEPNAESFLLAKVKSFEYVFFRKLREFFKYLLPSTRNMFENEDNDDMADKPPKPEPQPKKKSGKDLEDPIFSNGKFGKNVHNKLLEFSEILDKYEPNLVLKSRTFYEFFFMQVVSFLRDPKGPGKMYANYPCFLRAVRYCIEHNLNLNTTNLDQIIPTVWSMSLIFNKIEPHVRVFPDLEQLHSQPHRSPTFEGQPKHVKILMPITVLGSGKSFLFEKLAEAYRDRGYVTYLISSDELSWHIIESRRFQTNNYLEGADLFEVTRKDYRDQWGKSVDRLFEKPLSVEAKQFCFLIDKNHHPFHFNKIKKGYEERLTNLGYTYDFVLVYMGCQRPMAWKGSDGAQTFHPASPKLFYDSLVRINRRKDNVLMQNATPQKNLEVLAEFFSFFTDYKVLNYKNSKNVHFPFYNETDASFESKIGLALGPILEAFLQAKKDKNKKSAAILADLGNACDRFFAENTDQTLELLFPPKQVFESGLASHGQIFFGVDQKIHSLDIKNLDYVCYGGFFFDTKTFESVTQLALKEISQFLKAESKSAVTTTAAKFIWEFISEGFNKKKVLMVDVPHITSVHLGGSAPTKEAQEIWNRAAAIGSRQFKLTALVVIQDKLAFFVVESSAKDITEKQLPHITLFRSESYKANDSNTVAEHLRSQGADLDATQGNFVKLFSMPDLSAPSQPCEVYVFGLTGIWATGEIRKIYL